MLVSPYTFNIDDTLNIPALTVNVLFKVLNDPAVVIVPLAFFSTQETS